MKTLFLIGFVSWIVHVLATGISYASFNHIKDHLSDPTRFPTWYKVDIWILNLTALGYWACTILIFFSFRSPPFMITAILAILGVVVWNKSISRYKVSHQVTAEEVQNFKLGFRGALTVWWYAGIVFLIGALPYIALFLFI